MKNLIYMIVATALMGAVGCNKIPDHLRNDKFVPEDSAPAANIEVMEGAWKIDTIVPGAVWKKFAGKDSDITNNNQIVNLMEIDLSNPRFHVKFHYQDEDKLRATDQVFASKREKEGAICAMNGAYEAASCYIRTNYKTWQSISSTVIPDTKVRQWKSEACITSDGHRDVQIIHKSPAENPLGKEEYIAQTRQAYDLMTDKANIFSSAPMLIDDYEPVGAEFVNRMIQCGHYGGSIGMGESGILRLDYENPIRHQGVTHPRAVVALTGEESTVGPNKLLLIIIDGRWTAAVGMTAEQVTRFIAHHFNPRYAINMDGGGSSCLCIRGRGEPSNNVVNYPTDNDTFDHLGIRSVNSHFYVTYDEPQDEVGGEGEEGNM